MIKIEKEKLNKIIYYMKEFIAIDSRIEKLNLEKENQLKNIIDVLNQNKFLTHIKNINEVKSAKFNIWRDVENPNWIELEIIAKVKKSSEDFDSYDEYLKYEENIFHQIYGILDSNPPLDNIILPIIKK